MRTLGNLLLASQHGIHSLLGRSAQVCVYERGWDSGGAKNGFTKHGPTPCIRGHL